MWIYLIVGGILIYSIYRLEKRVKTLEELRGPEYSHWFSIDCAVALSDNIKFREMLGIKSVSLGKDYEKWPKEEKTKWGKYPTKFTDRLKVKFTYLASENAYLISPRNGIPTLIHRDELKSSLLYSAIVAGDEDGLKPHIEFDIYERFVDSQSGRRWYLIPCLTYNDEIFEYEKRKFEVLCDFPHMGQKNEDELKKLGFEIQKDGGNDIYEDSFGEKHAIPTVVKFKKNGVEFTYVY